MSFNDAFAFHHIPLLPSSWPLCRLSFKRKVSCSTTIPFGSSLTSPSLGEAKVTIIRSRGIPALAYLYESWPNNTRRNYERWR